MTNYNTSR